MQRVAEAWRVKLGIVKAKVSGAGGSCSFKEGGLIFRGSPFTLLVVGRPKTELVVHVEVALKRENRKMDMKRLTVRPGWTDI